jgi:hypothetical protein
MQQFAVLTQTHHYQINRTSAYRGTQFIQGAHNVYIHTQIGQCRLILGSQRPEGVQPQGMEGMGRVGHR